MEHECSNSLTVFVYSWLEFVDGFHPQGVNP
jgi:hypothetical protein